MVEEQQIPRKKCQLSQIKKTLSQSFKGIEAGITPEQVQKLIGAITEGCGEITNPPRKGKKVEVKIDGETRSLSWREFLSSQCGEFKRGGPTWEATPEDERKKRGFFFRKCAAKWREKQA